MGVKELFSDIRELIPVLVLVALVLSVVWCKMALGTVLVVVGAFWPTGKSDSPKGSSTVSVFGFKMAMNGPLRLGVIGAGIIVLVFTLYTQMQQTGNGQLNSPAATLTNP